MFTGKDRQASQTLVANSTIKPQIQEIPKLIFNAIQTTIKADKHFWHYQDEPVSDLWKKSDQPIHSLPTCIIQLMNSCLFSNSNMKETFKITILQHAIIYHGARDWTHLQNQSTLTYDKLLFHCRMPETWCKQFQKAKGKGHTELTTITKATWSTSLIHQDTLNTQLNYTRCGHSHPSANCPAYWNSIIIVVINAILWVYAEHWTSKQPRDREQYSTHPDRYQQSYNRDSRESSSQHPTCNRRRSPKSYYQDGIQINTTETSKLHEDTLPANTLSHDTHVEYPIQFVDTDYELDTSSFPYLLLKTNPAKPQQNCEKHLLQDHHLTKVLQDIDT